MNDRSVFRCTVVVLYLLITYILGACSAESPDQAGVIDPGIDGKIQ